MVNSEPILATEQAMNVITQMKCYYLMLLSNVHYMTIVASEHHYP